MRSNPLTASLMEDRAIHSKAFFRNSFNATNALLSFTSSTCVDIFKALLFIEIS